MKHLLIVILSLIVMSALITSCANRQKEDSNEKDTKTESTLNIDNIRTELGGNKTMPNKKNIKTIYLAGGCFWGVEGYFSKLNGIVDTDVGYANGNTDDTNYQKIHDTEHAETVKIDYDISAISLEEVLLHYFRIIDPKSLNKQGNDKGIQYRTGVYYVDEKDLKIIDKIFAYETEIHGDIVVEKERLENFILAEDYHQDYLANNPNGYCHINLNDANRPLFEENFVVPTDEELKEKLDSLSYSVLRESATERAGSSELEGEYRKGIYIDKATGEALFSSADKFDSGCGWPSFSKPILSDKMLYIKDNSFGMQRIEVRSEGGDNHLGHVFSDGPSEKGGLRYCINGAALEFIPYEEMEEKGYGEFKILVE